ncbi:MAG: DUF4149 domain-containing protein [Burkholderiales bacterium]
MRLMRVRLLVATLWVGSLWTIGYVAAPTLFATLFDRVLAGTAAGNLFRVEAWLSIMCGALLLALQIWQDKHVRSREARLMGAMLACTLIGYFCLQPFMAALREAAGPAGVMASDGKLKFAVLHGVASGFYLIESLLGGALILKIRAD